MEKWTDIFTKKLRKLASTSWILTFFLLMSGMLFLYFEVVDYGFTFFVLFPASLGFSVGVTTKNNVVYIIGFIAVTVGLLLFLICAIMLGLEGLVCVIMAFPIIFMLILIGYLFGLLVRNYILKKSSDHEKKLYSVIFPLVVLVVGSNIERYVMHQPQIISVTTTVVLPYEPGLVFNGIKSMDTLNAKKPVLMQAGLPAPYKCVLEDNKIGAKRTCIFSNGKIVAEITDYKPDTLLQMKVIEYDLMGIEWFKFIDAGYTFEKTNGGTQITRTTRYQSILKPRFYWKPLETYAINQEHLFVLRSLEKNLRRNP